MKICMDKFDQVYQSIISEAKFEDKKWIEKETMKQIFIFNLVYFLNSNVILKYNKKQPITER